MQNKGYSYSDPTKQYLAETMTNADTLITYQAVSHPSHTGSMCWQTPKWCCLWPHHCGHEEDTKSSCRNGSMQRLLLQSMRRKVNGIYRSKIYAQEQKTWSVLCHLEQRDGMENILSELREYSWDNLYFWQDKK